MLVRSRSTACMHRRGAQSLGPAAGWGSGARKGARRVASVAREEAEPVVWTAAVVRALAPSAAWRAAAVAS